MDRRALLTGLACVIAAPAIVRASPVRSFAGLGSWWGVDLAHQCDWTGFIELICDKGIRVGDRFMITDSRGFPRGVYRINSVVGPSADMVREDTDATYGLNII